MDLSNFKKDKKTTIVGLANILLMILVALGVVSQEESEGVKSAVTSIVDAVGGDWVYVAGVAASSIGGVFLLFSNSKEKSPE